MIPATAEDIRSRLKLDTLKPKQRRFILAYAGSGDMIQSIQQAGYTTRHSYQAKNTAYRLLQIPEVRENLELLELELESELIATSAECKARITEIMRDPTTETQHVLAAAKMLLQANGDLDPRLRLEIESRSHEVREYIFSGPESNFLKSRQDDCHETIELEPMQTYTLEDPFSL